MRISEFSIVRYGPLPSTGRVLLDRFNLLFGKNEDGKTLTIDALVKLLLGKGSREFSNIDRVGEKPEGYVVLGGERGEEAKLPDQGDLTKISGLRPFECRNIFVIRNSDLLVPSDEEEDFYTSVTARLSGLRTQQIFSVRKKLRDIGKLTRADSAGDLSDAKSFGNIRSRVDKARALIREICDVQNAIHEEKLDELEEALVSLEEQLETTMRKTEHLERARKRERYEKGKQALDLVADAISRLVELEVYNEEDERLWRDSRRDIQAYERELRPLAVELNEKKREFDKVSEESTEIERDFQLLEAQKKRLDDEVKPELKTYEIKKGELAQQQAKNRFFLITSVVSAVLLSIALFGALVRQSLPFYVLVALFLVSTVILYGHRLQFVKDRAWLSGVFERIKLAASGFGLESGSIEQILMSIQKLEQRYSSEAHRLQSTKSRTQVLKNDIQTAKKRIAETEEKMQQAQDKIDDLNTKSGVQSYQAYADKLRLKEEHEKTLGEQESLLTDRLETKADNREENIAYWHAQIEELEQYKDEAKGVRWDEKAFSQFKEQESSYREHRRVVRDQMLGLRKNLGDIERETNRILQLEGDYLHCKTSVDLRVGKRRLQEFIDVNENDKDNALKVMKVFEDIEAEEKEKVCELFGRDSAVSAHFSEITNGLYEEVAYSRESATIQVKRRDGTVLPADKLSGGAYDQLYLSIRLALGEKLLREQKGFFMMDDPFIKADAERLDRQLAVLREIAESGWQIIYFSAKEEVKDALKEDIAKGVVNFVELKSMFP